MLKSYPYLLCATLAFGFTTALLTGCGSSGPSISTDFDSKVDFTQYCTFAFQRRQGRIYLLMACSTMVRTLRGYGNAGWWASSYNNFWVRNYTQGTLLVHLIDVRAKALVWRAYVSGEVTRVPNQDQVNRVVERVFKNYPLKPKRP